MKRARTTSSVVLACLFVAGMLGSPLSAHAGSNLILNPGFEQSVLEPAPALEGQQPQPLLPVEWTFEGLAGLFDHSPHTNTTPGGSRAAAISDPLSTKEHVCGPEIGCEPSPANGPRDDLRPTYSITPAWRTLNPVNVQGDKTYTLAVCTSMDLVTEDLGAVTYVRWLDAGGNVIQQVEGPARRNTHGADTLNWSLTSGTLTSPAGAAHAHILLAHEDDLFISQVRFDDVWFGRNPGTGALPDCNAR